MLVQELSSSCSRAWWQSRWSGQHCEVWQGWRVVSDWGSGARTTVWRQMVRRWCCRTDPAPTRFSWIFAQRQTELGPTPLEQLAVHTVPDAVLVLEAFLSTSPRWPGLKLLSMFKTFPAGQGPFKTIQYTHCNAMTMRRSWQRLSYNRSRPRDLGRSERLVLKVRQGLKVLQGHA